jgi:hypothetical protein
VLVYHRTDHADAIEREGFRDAEGRYLTSRLYRGVWVSAEWPLDENEGADGDVALELAIPDELFDEYEWVEEAKTYREALIPARELNRHRATLRRLTDDEIGALTLARFDYWRKRLGH